MTDNAGGLALVCAAETQDALEGPPQREGERAPVAGRGARSSPRHRGVDQGKKEHRDTPLIVRRARGESEFRRVGGTGQSGH